MLGSRRRRLQQLVVLLSTGFALAAAADVSTIDDPAERMVRTELDNGLVVLRIPYAWTFTAFGVVIVSSVMISLLIEQKRLSLGAEKTSEPA